MEREFSVFMTPFDRIEKSFESPKLYLILWGLSNIAKVARADARGQSLFRRVCGFFTHSSQSIEYAAVCAAAQLCSSFPDICLTQVLPLVLNRLRTFPAVEYVSCLTGLMKTISPNVLDEQIFPLVLEFLKMAEIYQYAAAELLCIIPFAKLEVSPDDFALFVASPVVGSQYLARIIRAAAGRFGRPWLENTLPKLLLLQANSYSNIREGVVRALTTEILEADQVDSQAVCHLVMAAVGWAATSESLAMALIEKADVITKYRNGEFFLKVRDIGLRLMQSGSTLLRPQLCRVCAENLQTFTGQSEPFLARAYKAIAGDADFAVRLAFVSTFADIYGKCQSASFKDTLFSCLIQCYSSPDLAVRRALATNGRIYSRIGPGRLNSLIPLFLKLVEGFSALKASWRIMSECVSVFVQFPTEVIEQYWSKMATFVNICGIRSPFALSKACILFYVSVTNPNNENKIMRLLLEHFGRNRSHSLRSLFIPLICSVAFCISFECFVNEAWPMILNLASDPVVSVRVTFLNHVPKLRVFFRQQGDSAREHELGKKFSAFGADKTPYVEGAWKKASEEMSAPMGKGPVPRSGSACLGTPSLRETMPRLTGSQQKLSAASPKVSLGRTFGSGLKIKLPMKPPAQKSVQGGQPGPKTPTLPRRISLGDVE
jgi:hypothetical protein